MDLYSELDEAYTTMTARRDAYQAAFASFRERPDDIARFRECEEASFALLNAFVNLNQAIFNLHYSFGGNHRPSA